MSKSCRIALVGDYNPSVTAHQAIPLAVELAARHHGVPVHGEWVHTSKIEAQLADVEKMFAAFDAIWCVPASPYANTDGALMTIRVAREGKIPFLGTCAGFQHAVIEYARNVLGWATADHAENNPHAEVALIAPLSCSLVEKTDEIRLAADSLIGRSYGTLRIVEGYHCNYGLDRAYAERLFSNRLRATGWDENGEVRALEIAGHPFFVGTLFQPERRALKGELPPLVRDFVGAALGAEKSRQMRSSAFSRIVD
jgi:CTP synthase